MNLLNLRFAKTENSKFHFYQINNLKRKGIFERLANKAVSQASINQTELGKVFLFVPSLPEQQKIASFLSSIDEKINLTDRRLELMKQYKQGVMQQLFSQEIRFKDDNGNDYPDWMDKKLGDLCSITTGKLDANAMKEDGKYDFYTSGIQKYKIDIPAFEGPAITIAGNGATVGYLHLADGKFNAYQRTYVLTNFKSDRKYIYSAIGLKLPAKIHREARAGNIPYIVMPMLTDLAIPYPSLPEQQKIASFLSSIDEKITLIDRQLENLKQYKKSLLQQMFV